MHIDFLVEEQSMEIVLENIVPKIIGTSSNITFQIHDFRGRDRLLGKLQDRMRGYAAIMKDQHDLRVVVLIDEDREDCQKLKAKLEAVATDVGLMTRSKSAGSRFKVLNRIVVEELEAWFFGDLTAIREAYPYISPDLLKKKAYRDPDAIPGGTWESLERELCRGRKKLGKGAIARAISPYMQPERNCSKSFQVFRDGLLELIKFG